MKTPKEKNVKIKEKEEEEEEEEEEDQQATGRLLCSPLITSKWIVCVIYSLFFFSFSLSFTPPLSSSYSSRRERSERKRARERERERESNTAGGVSFVAVEEESERRMAAAGNGPAMFELSIVSKRWKEIQKRKRKKKTINKEEEGGKGGEWREASPLVADLPTISSANRLTPTMR